MVEFKAGSPSEDGDKLYIVFPKTIPIPKEPVCTGMGACLSKNTIKCSTESTKIVATFEKIKSGCLNAENKLYAFYIEGIQNAGTMITSKDFNSYVLTKLYQKVLEFDVANVPRKDKTITNLEPADLDGNKFIVRQASLNYGVHNEFELKIVPTNPMPRLGWIEVEIPAELGM